MLRLLPIFICRNEIHLDDDSDIIAQSWTQDVVVDASDEDLPVEWVKRLRNNGSFYYYNSMTGAMQRSRPDERIETNNATGAPAVPQRSSLLTRAFQVRVRSFGIKDR